jgi:hypothetical protein
VPSGRLESRPKSRPAPRRSPEVAVPEYDVVVVDVVDVVGMVSV